MRGNPHVEGRYNTTTYTTVRPTILPLNSWANLLHNTPNYQRIIKIAILLTQLSEGFLICQRIKPIVIMRVKQRMILTPDHPA